MYAYDLLNKIKTNETCDMPDKITQATLKQLRHIASMVMNAAQEDNLENMLQRIVDTARELIGTRYAALGVPDQHGGLKLFKVSGITKEEISKIPHQPVGLGLLGSIMQNRETLRLDQMQLHPHASGFPEGHPHMESLLGVPIQLGDQLFGIFYLSDKNNGELFTEDDEWLLEILAGNAALVIAEKYLQDQRRKIALMREREQIGMTLHDGVIQSIYSLGMRLDLAKRHGTITEEDIDMTLDGLNQIIEDIRNIIFQIKEDNGEGLTLRRRIKHLFSQLYIPDDVNVSLSLPDHALPIDYDRVETLEMMINECLSNIIRHANAQNIHLQVHDNKDYIEVIIKDDGIGFDLNNLKNVQGLGLKNLERRARIHGGSVQITSTPRKGTTIKIQLPMD